MSSILQEVVSVQSNNSCLVRLRNISKNHIHHAYRGREHYSQNHTFMLEWILSNSVFAVSFMLFPLSDNRQIFKVTWKLWTSGKLVMLSSWLCFQNTWLWLWTTYQQACGICVGGGHLRWWEWCWCVSLPRWEGHDLSDGKTRQRRPAPPETQDTGYYKGNI